MANPFGRLGKRVKKGMEVLLSPAEDPRQTHVSTFERQRGLLVKVQTALQEVATAKSRLEAKAAETRAKLPQLEELAVQALREEHEDLARLRLQRRQLAGIELQGLEKQLLEIEREEHRLSLTEQRLSSQLAAFYTRQELIAARYSAAEAQVHIGEALSGVSTELAELSQAMAQAERKSVQMQARAAAIDRLVDEGLLEIPAAVDLAVGDDFLAEGEIVDVEEQLTALKAEIKGKA
ncbi:MAG: PspA/IM30 family protein [Chloroflexi bacterium]|jgi:phage shock protein A|nr:PspA/IM30 family protein [Chloroflexota bacterium]